MNHLKARRVEVNMTQPALSQKLKSIDSHMDVGMVSRFENGVCLPTPPVMEALETALEADRLDLYDAEDLDLLNGATHYVKVYRKRHENPDMVRKCYRIPREFAESLPDDILAVCGYASWNDFHMDAMRWLRKRYEKEKVKCK